MTPLEHLEQLAREGWNISILHTDDRSHGAPEPVRKLFTVTARRVTDDTTNIRRGRAETLAEAAERARHAYDV